MKIGLNRKGVIVAGGSRGIGFAIADAFAAEGANVSICGRTHVRHQNIWGRSAFTELTGMAEIVNITVCFPPQSGH